MNKLESGHYSLRQYLWTLKNEACSNVWSSAHTFKASFQVGQAHRFHRRMCDMLQLYFMLQHHSASWDNTYCSPIKNWVVFFRGGGTSYSFRNHIPTFWIFRRAGWGDLFYFLFSKFHCTNQVVIKQGLDRRETSFPKNIWTLELVYAHIVIIGKLATAAIILKIYIYIFIATFLEWDS